MTGPEAQAELETNQRGHASQRRAGAIDWMRQRAAAVRRAVHESRPAIRRARALEKLGEAAVALGDHAAAARAFAGAATSEPSNSRLWLLLARSHREAGELDGARTAARQALLLAPEHPDVLREAGETSANARDRPALAAVISRLEPLEARPPRTLRDVVRWANLAEDGRLAERALEATRASGHDASEARLVAARARWRDGQHRHARALIAGTADADLRIAARLELEAGSIETGLDLLARIPDPETKLLLKAAGSLRVRGHLARAAGVLALCPPADAAAARARVEGEMAVLNGAWAPPLRRALPHVAVSGRVLHVVGRSRPHVESGFAIRTHSVMRAQRLHGLDPVAVTRMGFPPGAGSAALERLDGIAYHRIAPGDPLPARLDDELTGTLEALDALCATLRPAVLHPASNFVNALVALRLRERLQVPVVYEVRGFWEESWVARQPDRASARASDSYRGRRALERSCMLEADRVVTLAETMKRALVERGIPAEKIVVVPNAVDADAFVWASRDTALARRLGLEDAEAVLGYVSSLYPFEGIDVLLRATAALRARGREVAVLVVGDGPERLRLEALAAALGLGAAAVFTGRVPHDDVLRYYGLIDVFVVPRKDERVCELVTPLKPFEAMATGRAVVVADLPALREIVEPGRTGQSFRPEDHDDLADVVEPLVDDGAERLRLGTAAREWVLAERTWDRNGSRYRALMDDLEVL